MSSNKNNRESFLMWSEATHAVALLVPRYATKAQIHKDENGHWINVWWCCGVIAPLTIQEYAQAQEGI